jgi:hypothetical protein
MLVLSDRDASDALHFPYSFIVYRSTGIALGAELRQF